MDFTFDGDSKGVLGKPGKVLRITLPEGSVLPKVAPEAAPEVVPESIEPAVIEEVPLPPKQERVVEEDFDDNLF